MTIHNNKEVLEYWNRPEVESMYDKYLLNAEIELIASKLRNDSKILDAGCGEGEGTYKYAQIKNSFIHAVDFSETRLLKAKERLSNFNNILLKQVDFLGSYELDKDYDFVISQRFLINLMEWDLQKKVIIELSNLLKTGGQLLLLEGSEDGVIELNAIRKIFGLDPIPIKWHNLFFNNHQLEKFLKQHNLKLIEKEGLGDYFFLTRGIRPYFDKDLNWNCDFNQISSTLELKSKLGLKYNFSRLVLWIIEKEE